MAFNLRSETLFTEDKASAQPPLPPESIAPFFPQLDILECLGRGGMGVVYKARQKSLNRMVALKLLAPERAQDPQFAARFAKEAQALAVMNHPNIVTIHDHGQAGGYYFLLMEFVDGVTLRQLLARERVSTREALAIVPQICDALQYAHDQGIVHRDIKPENILLDRRGRVKVADFGLAKIIGSQGGDQPAGNSSASPAAAVTDAGKVMGTPQYMSPEQIQAPGEVDHRADIYALGVVFYQMLTGELPGKQIEPPSRKVQVDVRLDEVVLRALEKKPELRYQKASILKTQVENIATTLPAGEPSRQAPRRSGRLLYTLILGCIALGILGLLVVPNYWKRHDGVGNGTIAAQPFTPVVERIVNDGAAEGGRDMMLDLDTARVISEPKDPSVVSDQDLMIRKLAEDGVDLAVVYQRDAWGKTEASDFDGALFKYTGQHLPAGPLAGFIGYNLGTATLQADAWNTLSSGDLASVMHNVKSPVDLPLHFHSVANGLPLTLGFRTREGALGIMQVFGFSDNPRGLKIRYKLVRGENQGKTGHSIAEQPPRLEFLSRQGDRVENCLTELWQKNGQQLDEGQAALARFVARDNPSQWWRLPETNWNGALVAVFTHPEFDEDSLSWVCVKRPGSDEALAGGLIPSFNMSSRWKFFTTGGSLGEPQTRGVIAALGIYGFGTGGLGPKADLELGYGVGRWTEIGTMARPTVGMAEEFTHQGSKLWLLCSVGESNPGEGRLTILAGGKVESGHQYRLLAGLTNGVWLRALSVTNSSDNSRTCFTFDAAPQSVSSLSVEIRLVHKTIFKDCDMAPLSDSRPKPMAPDSSIATGASADQHVSDAVGAASALEQQLRIGLQFEPVVWCKGAIVRAVYVRDANRKAVVVMEDPQIGRQDVVLTADDSGRFEGSLHGEQGLKWWYPISVLPADSARLEAEYRALAAGDRFDPDRDLDVRRPEGVAWSLFGIDFETAKSVPVPTELAGKLEDDIESLRGRDDLARWAREHGVDAFARITTNAFQFTFFDMQTHLLYLADGWANLKPDRINRALVSGKLPGSGRIGDSLTNVFDNTFSAVAFRTRANHIGAWRLGGKLGDPGNPDGFRLRYRLIHGKAQ